MAGPIINPRPQTVPT
jgi:hypothetical protein